MDNKVKYIPVKALRQELAGCQFAIQCDQGSTYEYDRIRAIKNILDWIDTPVFLERLAHCGFEVPKTEFEDFKKMRLFVDDFDNDWGV